MAKLQVVDTASPETFYSDLNKGLGDRYAMVIGHNTRLVRKGYNTIAIRLYSTDVAEVYVDNSVYFDTGGYTTVTTMDRIRTVAQMLGYTVWTKKGTAYIRKNGDTLTHQLDGFHTLQQAE